MNKEAMGPTVVALGASCQCTYQIRRFTGNERASYFDWLGTPHDALVEVLRRDFRDCFLKDNLKLARGGETVIDSATGVSYRHAFRWCSGLPLIDPAAIDEQYEEQREKYAALAKRWFECMSTKKLVFVRHDSPSASQLQELLQLIGFRCGRRFRFLLIADARLRSSPISLHHPALTIEYVDTGAFEEFGWQGSDAVWDELLGKHLCLHYTHHGKAGGGARAQALGVTARAKSVPGNKTGYLVALA